MTTPACYYQTWPSFVFGWSHFIPVLACPALFIASGVTGDVIFSLLSWYLFIMWYALVVAQSYLNIVRVDPFCPAYHTYSVPSIVTFYAVSLFTFFAAYVITEPAAAAEKRQIRYTTWLTMFAFGFLPPLLLVYYDFNTWSEIVLSCALAIFPTIGYVYLLRYIIRPRMAMILLSPPLNWFGYESNYLKSTPAELADAKFVCQWRKRGCMIP